jgi:hypothetical protein
MRVSGRSLHVSDERIDRAQAHGVREVLDGRVRLAEPHSCPTAVEPRPCNVRIERNRPIDQGYPSGQVVNHVGEREPGGAERDRVVLAQRRGAAGEPGGFRASIPRRSHWQKRQCSDVAGASPDGLFITIVLRPITTNSTVSAKNTSANAITKPSRCVIMNNCLSAIILASGP